MNNKLTHDELTRFLRSEGDEAAQLFARSEQVKAETLGRKTYLRGLIELSNICSKDCLYCGIRKSNQSCERYQLSDDDVLDCAKRAYDLRYGSVVIQAGENQSAAFAKRIERLLQRIKQLSNDTLAVTLSLGEQPSDTLKRWREAGADRYLLRIESSSEPLFNRIHPVDANHSFSTRVAVLETLRKHGYQVGSGVMIGLPFQSVDDLARDLLWMRDQEIDMCGMGPYLEHKETPLYDFREALQPLVWRKEMTLKMIASLRILMPTINIAATTALQTIEAAARGKAIRIGANVVMPNLTPQTARGSYKLYENKPTDEISLIEMILSAGDTVGFAEPGTSKHYTLRTAR